MNDMSQTHPELFGKEPDTVLIGCPTYSGLKGCLDAYLDAYDAFRWPNRSLMLVDNTNDEGKYAASIRAKVESVNGRALKRVNPSTDWEDTFYRSWMVLLTHALWNGYTWVLSLEQDVICPPLTVDTLLNTASYIKAPFVTHTYPYHNGKPGFYQGLGCTLMKTELLQGALTYAHKRIATVEGAIYDVAKRNSHAVLHQLLPIEHADADGRHWQFQKGTNDEVAIGIEG
jgi:hypothetical protein